MSTKGTSELAKKLKADVEREVHKAIGDNPALVAKVEEVIERIGEVAADDVIDEIHNPILRVVVREALHKAIESAFALLPHDGGAS